MVYTILISLLFLLNPEGSAEINKRSQYKEKMVSTPTLIAFNVNNWLLFDLKEKIELKSWKFLVCRRKLRSCFLKKGTLESSNLTKKTFQNRISVKIKKILVSEKEKVIFGIKNFPTISTGEKPSYFIDEILENRLKRINIKKGMIFKKFKGGNLVLKFVWGTGIEIVQNKKVQRIKYRNFSHPDDWSVGLRWIGDLDDDGMIDFVLGGRDLAKVALFLSSKAIGDAFVGKAAEFSYSDPLGGEH